MLATNPTAQAENLHDIEYGRVAGSSLRLDAHIPSGPGPFPAVIIVHGGGWVAGDRRLNVQPLFEPLANADFAWFSISYRLATDPLTFGVAIKDVQTAISWLQAHADEYKVNPARIALIGESAGAQLAAMAALQPGPGSAVKAVVAIYCPTDLLALARTSPSIPDSIRQSVKNSTFGPIVAEGLRQLSPINHVSPDMPPFLFIHGTADRLVPFSQSEEMCGKMKDAGATCELYAVPGAGHGIRFWDSSSYKRVMIEFLQKQLKP